MKKTIFILIVSLITSVNSALAGNIGVLDVDKIIQESLAVNDIQKKVDSKKSNYESEINKKQTSLEAEQKNSKIKKLPFQKKLLIKRLRLLNQRLKI